MISDPNVLDQLACPEKLYFRFRFGPEFDRQRMDLAEVG